MIALLDTDILIDVALARQPFADFSAQVLDAAERRAFRAYIAWHSISNFYYIVQGASKKRQTKKFIVELLTFVEIAPTRTKDALFAATLNVTDFEDALQIAAAKACVAEFIVTRNTKHYKKSPIQAQLPSEFLESLN